MSNRFYVNDVQIFGNNEMFDKTYEELKRQGAKWEDGTFKPIEITDPQALMEAVTEDSLLYLKKLLTKYTWSHRKNMKIKSRRFSNITDSMILAGIHKRDLISRLYRKDGTVRSFVWKELIWWVSEKRAFTPLMLYLAMQNAIEEKEGKLVLKEGCSITAEMY